jgi:hypothetical protein
MKIMVVKRVFFLGNIGVFEVSYECSFLEGDLDRNARIRK